MDKRKVIGILVGGIADDFEYMEKKDEEDVIRHGYMKESKLTNNSGPTDDAE